MKTQLSAEYPRQPELRSWAGTPQGAVPDRTISSADLFGSLREVGIEHQGAYYRLKITRQGKLILNK